MADTTSSTDNRPSAVQWRLLGDVHVHVYGFDEIRLGRRQRTVLALLLLRPNTSVSVDEIVTGLWGENPPKTARNSVQRFVSDIRRALGANSTRLITTANGYQLDVRDGELDVDEARQWLDLGCTRLREADAEGAHALLGKGLQLFRGTPLSGIEIEHLSIDALGPLTELHTNLQANRFDAALQLGLHAEIGGDLQRFAQENPSSEQAWVPYILGLYRSGRQRDALDAGEQFRQRLAEDHGITPSPRLAQLIHHILNHADELQIVATESPDGEPWTDEHRQAARKLPPQLTRLTANPFVGRTSPLLHGEAVIARLDAGEPAVTFVAGEPGVGKTRLAAELATMAATAGHDVFYGRSDEDIALPLGPWAEVLKQTTASDLAAITQAVRGPSRTSLRDILPQLPIGADEGGDHPLLSSAESRRAALFQAITTILNELAERRPITIILDDLQWADASTVQLVRHVSRHLVQPVWIIVTYRNDELTDQDLLPDVVATLLHEPHVSAFALEGIDVAEVAKLVQSLVPGVNEARLPDFAKSLHRDTKGNPFFTAEIVRNMVEAAPDQRTLQLTEPLSDNRQVPDSVRAVIRQRVARLGETAATALRTAAIFGREFRLAELSSVLEAPSEHVLSMLESGINARIIDERQDHGHRFVFVHDLMHHALYNHLSLSRQRYLHGQIAQTISRSTGTDSHQNSIRASEIAGHFVAARDPQMATQTIEAVIHAAEVSARRHAPAEAAILLARGLDALQDPDFVSGGGSPIEVDRLRLSMLVRRGVELRNAGDPEFRQALLDAGHLARDLGDIEAEVDAALANTRGLQTNVWEVDVDRVEQLHRAIEVLGKEESARRANLLASLASEQWADEDREESQRLRTEALALARRVNHPETLANVLARAARARNAGTTAAEFQDLAREMRTMIAESQDFDPYLVVNVLRTIQNQALRDADPVIVHEMAAAIRELKDRTQLPICVRASLRSDVLIAGLHGEAETYLQLAEQALVLSLEMGDPESLIVYEGHYFIGMSMLGRTREILPMVEQVAEQRADVGLYNAIAALGHYMVGDLTKCAERVDQGFAAGFDLGLDDYLIQTLQIWADSAAATNNRDACDQLYRLLAPHAGRLSGHVVHVTQPVDVSLGRLSRVLDRHEESLAHFDVADQICRDFAALWMQGISEISRAETLFKRDQAGDNMAARELVAVATRRAERLGHTSIIDLASRLSPWHN